MAKAMLDSRIIDLAFNKVFVKLALGEEVPLTIASLRVCSFHTFSPGIPSIPRQSVDNDLANSLVKLQNYSSVKSQNEKV